MKFVVFVFVFVIDYCNIVPIACAIFKYDISYRLLARITYFDLGEPYIDYCTQFMDFMS